MNFKSFLLPAFTAIILSGSHANAQTNGSRTAADAAGTQYRIKNLPFNSANSDFGLFPFSATNFFFSSNRMNENGSNVKQAYNFQNLPFLDIYMVTKSGDTSFSSPLALPSDVESKYNEGPIFYDANSSTFFITRNNYNKKKSEQSRYGVNRLKIYIENIDGTSFKSFGEFQYNNNAFSVGHAALSKDGQRIYFSSDMPGGSGGVDLYVCVKEGDKWSAPKNLGTTVNTAGNEMFPFVSADDKLYFSTNGHSTTSGLDIYCAERSGDEFKNLKRLDSPINSDQDDFSFFIFPDNKNGFFSSNRPGGKGDDDIYSFEPSNPVIKVQVMDEKGTAPIANAKIKISSDDLKLIEVTTDADGNFSYTGKWNADYSFEVSKEGLVTSTKSLKTEQGKDPFKVAFNLVKEEYGIEGLALNKDNNAGVAGVTVSLINKATGKILTVTTDDKGAFHFNVQKNADYIVRGEKTKFLTANVPFSTQGMALGIKKQNILMEELVVGKSIKIDNVYYDQGKWDIRADAKPELDKMVTLMNENPTMEVELSSHTDSRGSDASNMSLSDKRAKSVVAYIVSKGISSSRLVAKGYGETKLLNSCGNTKKCSDAEHQVNRRTEFKILKM